MERQSAACNFLVIARLKRSADVTPAARVQGAPEWWTAPIDGTCPPRASNSWSGRPWCGAPSPGRAPPAEPTSAEPASGNDVRASFESLVRRPAREARRRCYREEPPRVPPLGTPRLLTHTARAVITIARQNFFCAIVDSFRDSERRGLGLFPVFWRETKRAVAGEGAHVHTLESFQKRAVELQVTSPSRERARGDASSFACRAHL